MCEVGVGEVGEQKIVEDNWSIVPTFKSQQAKKFLSILKPTLVNKKATYSYQVSLTCISIYSFISKAIVIIYLVSTTYYHLEVDLMKWLFKKQNKTKVPVSKGIKGYGFLMIWCQRNRKKHI